MAATTEQKSALQSATIERIIYHDDADGIASMMIAKRAFPNARIKAVQYGQPSREELKAERDMLFVDMTPPQARASEFVNAGAWVIDHHKKQEEIVRAFGLRGIFADEKIEPGVSGALATAQALGLDDLETIREFASLVGTYDTWQIESEDFHQARIVEAVLRHVGADALEYRIAHATGKDFDILTDHEIEIGQTLVEMKDQAIQAGIDSTVLFDIGAGHTLAVFNDGPAKAISFYAERVRQGARRTDGSMVKANIACGFFYTQIRNIPRVVFSMRSDGSVDIGEFCKTFAGGGGHSKAAGFSTEGNVDPYWFIARHMEDWLFANAQLSLDVG